MMAHNWIDKRFLVMSLCDELFRMKDPFLLTGNVTRGLLNERIRSRNFCSGNEKPCSTKFVLRDSWYVCDPGCHFLEL